MMIIMIITIIIIIIIIIRRRRRRRRNKIITKHAITSALDPHKNYTLNFSLSNSKYPSPDL